MPDKQSLVQTYRFDPSQECKLASGDRAQVMFTHNLDAKFTLPVLDTAEGRLELRVGKRSLTEKCAGAFPREGSLIAYEFVNPAPIPEALTAVAKRHLSGQLHPPVSALLGAARRPR